MIKVSSSQMATVASVYQSQFVAEAKAQISSFSRVQMIPAPREGLDKIIELGMSRASSYGFKKKGPVLFYIELMVLLGADFDTDPQYASVTKRPLTQSSYLEEMDRADRLWRRACDYFKRTSGRTREHERAVLQRVSALRLQEVQGIVGTRHSAMLDWLGFLHPQKIDCLGQDAIEMLLNQADQHVVEERLHRSATPLLVGLMFHLGYGWRNDPLLPSLHGYFESHSSPATQQDKRSFIHIDVAGLLSAWRAFAAQQLSMFTVGKENGVG